MRLARRTLDGAWKRGRVVDRRGKRSQPQHSLALRTTASGAYLAWVQPGKGGSKIRGALVRWQRPVLHQAVAGRRAVGDFANLRLALAVGRGGRLLVAWTAATGSDRWIVVALGRVRGKPTVSRLFGVARLDPPLALLRTAGEATVAGSSPSTTTSGPAVLSVSTD